ncbi:actin-binding Rho-activating protein [Poecilia formosa]|nr:PREDICTED: actin-binding Rho-activating protein-like [Poecilia formosa]
MGTNSQRSNFKPEVDLNAPARSDDDRATPNVSVKGLKENWQKWSSEHQESQKLNPFSHDTRQTVVALHRGQDDYGRPQQGSLTEKRGKEAHTHIGREVQKLCEVIRDIGQHDGDRREDHRKGITVEFGKLFEHYVAISNTLVGILLRARKQGLVDFEGETLWQGKDDHVVITLLE